MALSDSEALTRLTEAITNLGASTSPPSSQSPEGSVHAVAIKLPDFWPEDPEIWFARIEAQLRSRSVTQDQTKFDYIVSALDNTTAAEVKSVLLNPPDQNKYENLKTALLGAFGKSQARKDAELLNISGLGDRSPSALLRKLESLNNDAETLRRAFFLAQLPAQVRSILALQEFPDIHDLAKAADRIVEANNISQTVTAVSVDRPSSANQRHHTAFKSNENYICHYHQRFGLKARNCKPGCLFSKLLSTNPSSNRPSQGNASAGRQ